MAGKNALKCCRIFTRYKCIKRDHRELALIHQQEQKAASARKTLKPVPWLVMIAFKTGHANARRCDSRGDWPFVFAQRAKMPAPHPVPQKVHHHKDQRPRNKQRRKRSGHPLPKEKSGAEDHSRCQPVVSSTPQRPIGPKLAAGPHKAGLADLVGH